MRTLAFALAALLSFAAQAAPYDVTCNAPCKAYDGTTQPAGTVLNIVQWDGATPFAPADSAGSTSVITLAPDPQQAATVYAAPTLQTRAQLAAGLISAGASVTSASSPSLNGTYSLDATATANINAISTFVLTNPGKFPMGASQTYMDMAGNAHVFTSTPQWQAFASAMAQLVAQIDIYGLGASPTAPSSNLAIP